MKIITLKVAVDDKDVGKLSLSLDRLNKSAQNVTAQRIISNLASRAITEAIGLTARLASEIADLAVESVKLAAKYQDVTNAMTVFAGSTRLAKEELNAIDRAAKDTPGLRLENAEKGYAQLRALGFEAENARKLVTGLGKQKLLNPLADEGSIQRVIVNLTQLSSGSARAGQDIKEIIHSMGSMKDAFQDAFNTTDPQKLKKFFESNPDEAVKKLADAMGRAEAPAGGLNNSIGKLLDTLIEVGREGGEPLLEPLTESFELLKTKIEENKSVWKSWGEYVADVIRGATADAKEFANNPVKSPLEIEGENQTAQQRQFFTDAYDYLLTPKNRKDNVYGFADRGAEIRQAQEAKKFLTDEFRQRTSRIDTSTNTFDLSSEGTKKLLETEKERQAIEKTAERNRLRREESAKAQSLAALKIEADEAKTILQNRFEVEQAIRDANTRYTAQEEIKFLSESGKAKNDFLQSEIARVAGFYNKQIELQSGNDEETRKLTGDKNKALSDLNTNLKINAIDTFEEIQKQQKRINEESRKAAIDSKQLLIRESSSLLDKQVFDIERAISRQTVSTEKGYGDLVKLTQSNYSEVSRLTREGYELQLKDKSLTGSQIINLTKEMYLAEQNLAEQNRRAIIEIEENKYRESLNKLETAFNRQKELFDSFAQSTQFGIGLLSADAFASNSSSLIQRSLTGADLDTLKRQTQDAISRQRLGLEQSKSSTGIDLDNAIKSGDAELVKSLSADLLNLNDSLIENQKQFNDWGSLIDENVFKINSLVEKIKNGGGVIADFDNLRLEALKIRQKRENDSIDLEVASYAERAKIASKAGNTLDGETFIYGKLSAERKKSILGMQNEAETAAFLTQTIEGLNAEFNKLKSGDKVSVDLVKESAEKAFLSERNSLLRENIALEQGYYKDSEYLAEQRKNKLLGFEREIFELRQQLNQKAVFNQSESDAKVLDFLNSQIKGASEIFADFRIGLGETFFEAIDSPFKALSERLEGLNPIIKGLAQTFLSLANDIVRAFSKDIILKLLGLSGGISNTGGSSSGGFLSNIFGGLFGGGRSGGGSVFGGGNQGSGVFSFGGSNPFSGAPFSTASAGLGGRNPFAANFGFGGGSSSGSSGFSSIFGSQGLGNNVGTYGAFGAGAGILGGLIGGRVGGFISGAGSGLGIGASIGSMIAPGIGTAIGAGIGALAGGLLSLFGGDPKRKEDKKKNLPALNKGFLDAFAELQKILEESNALNYRPPEGALTDADKVIGEMKSGFGVQFLSKKYQKESQSLIAQKLKEAADIRAQIENSVLNAKTYAADDARLIPVFAKGNFFGRDDQRLDMRRGYINGGQLGVDRHLGLFADGEAIINQNHQENIRRIAGFDVLAYAGIPNYPKKYADGNYFAPTIRSFESQNFTSMNGNAQSMNITASPNINVSVSSKGEFDIESISEAIVDKIANSELKTKLYQAMQTARVYSGSRNKGGW